MIPYGKQDISSKDLNAVIKVLKSNYLTQGPLVPEFEKKLSQYVDAKFGVATNSATSSLHIALKALGVKKGDTVWTSPITFVASANAALYCDAKIDFVDIDPSSFNICPNLLQEKISKTLKNGKLPKVIIPVHMCGLSSDAKKIRQITKKYGIKILDDASHSLGASFQNHKVGCCKYADISVFSFHPVKIITSGEGGMAVTNDKDLKEKMDLYRSHGITKDSKKFITPETGRWYFEQQTLGWNYRMNDIEASLGIEQLNRIDKFISKRNSIAKIYKNSLSDEISFQDFDDSFISSYHLFVIQLKDEETRNSLFNYLYKKGLGFKFITSLFILTLITKN